MPGGSHHEHAISFLQITLVLILMALSPTGLGASPAYMYVVGGDQGPIEGDVVISGRENSFEVNELHHLTTADQVVPTMRR